MDSEPLLWFLVICGRRLGCSLYFEHKVVVLVYAQLFESLVLLLIEQRNDLHKNIAYINTGQALESNKCV